MCNIKLTFTLSCFCTIVILTESSYFNQNTRITCDYMRVIFIRKTLKTIVSNVLFSLKVVTVVVLYGMKVQRII